MHNFKPGTHLNINMEYFINNLKYLIDALDTKISVHESTKINDCQAVPTLVNSDSRRQELKISFNDKVVVITGASAGIGAAIAVKFAEKKAIVVLTARNEGRLKEVAEKCQEYGAKTLMIIADVSKDCDVKKMINTAISQCGKIDVLINNAGIVGKAMVYDENAIEVYDRIMNTNLRSIVYLTNLAAPHLIKTKGNIVNISSINTVNTMGPGQFAYCVSKAAMDHFTRCAALDLGPKGVRVNTVNPGPVRTEIIDNFGVNKADHDAFWQKFAERTVLGRISEPEEIADLVLFVASDKAKAIIGSAYITDNGVLVNRKD